MKQTNIMGSSKVKILTLEEALLSPEQIEEEIRKFEEKRKAEEINKEAQIEEQKTTTKDKNNQQKPQPLIFHPHSGNFPFWTIPQVNYRGQVKYLDISDSLLDNGSRKTQDEWILITGKELEDEEFYTPDLPLIYAGLSSAYDLRNDSTYKNHIEEMRLSLRKLLSERILTLSRIIYLPIGRDTIIHNCGLINSSIKNEYLTNDTQGIPINSLDYIYKSLLETQDSKTRVKDIFKWLSGGSTYIWRRQTKLPVVRESPISLNINIDGFHFDCERSIDDSFSSLGMRLR